MTRSAAPRTTRSTGRRPDGGPDARRLAIDALTRIDADGAYANLLLPTMLASSELGPADRRFSTELVYGATRMRRACDAAIAPYVLRELDGPTRAALRLGAYQLLFLRTPAHAAVGATVAAVPNRTRGLVNAVLRRVAAHPPVWPDDATRLSYPDWIVDRLRRDLGDAAAYDALETMNRPPPVHERTDGYVQDRASQWVADAVEVGVGQRVLDVGAAPGGKSTAMAAAVTAGDDGGSGPPVIAVEVRPGRARLLGRNVRSLGARVAVCCADGTRLPLRPSSFDRILVDAPCSGLGALRRRPDARWRIEADAVDRLATLQLLLLEAALPLLAPGGMLVYSVCTMTAAETSEVGERFADRHPELSSAAPLGGLWRPHGRGSLLLPQAADTDGMYVLRLWRT